MSTPSPRPPDFATGDTLHASDEALGHALTIASAGRLPVPAIGLSDSDADLADSATMTSGGRAAAPDVATDDTHDGAAVRLRDPATLPSRLDRYHILEHLGAGGMGVVFAAYDPDLDRRVAVKLLKADRGGRESQVRLLREAQALARLSHPNVVQIHDARVVGEQIFIAMEFVRGQDLRAWLSAQRRADSEVLRVFLDAGRGLAAAHAEGLVHRDFKPETRPSSQKAPHPAKPRGSPSWRAFSEGRSAARCPAGPLRAPNPAPKTLSAPSLTRAKAISFSTVGIMSR